MDAGNPASNELKTVLLTGASGFIGRRLRDALLERGVDVVALRRASSPQPAQGRSVAVDYSDVGQLRAVFQDVRPSHVFHVAGVTKGVTYQDFTRGNLLPTQNLLEAAKAAPPVRFVHMSTLAAWGPSTPEKPHVETDPPKPIEYYGQSKLEAEQAVIDSGLSYVFLRPGGVYGPGDVDYFELFRTAASGFNLYFGNRNRWMSVIYVDDLIELTLSAATHSNARDRGYFATDGVPVTWEGFQKQVVEEAGRKVRDIDIPEAFVGIAAWGGELVSRLDGQARLANRQKATMGRQSAWTGSGEAAQKEIGFVPKVTQAEGVRKTMAWYRAEAWIRSRS